ncbi:MAG: protocatechuate 3,4-dioxygenase subunit alpha [Actinobacteria bacterium]|nr:MAG: protocatechuate 3,4-dioxygenase subunit alpha [Actinomycetota bacterium]
MLLTPSQTVGPFFALGLPDAQRLVEEDEPGALSLEGVVYDGAGDPVPDAVVEIWQPDRRLWGRCRTDAGGRYGFVTVKPGPVDGQAPHIAMAIFARGLLKQVVTRVYFPDEEEANAADPVLALAGDATLVARDEDGALRFDVHLQGERQTAFLDV